MLPLHFQGDVLTHLNIKLTISLLRRLTQPFFQRFPSHQYW